MNFTKIIFIFTLLISTSNHNIMAADIKAPLPAGESPHGSKQPRQHNEPAGHIAHPKTGSELKTSGHPSHLRLAQSSQHEKESRHEKGNSQSLTSILDTISSSKHNAPMKPTDIIAQEIKKLTEAKSLLSQKFSQIIKDEQKIKMFIDPYDLAIGELTRLHKKDNLSEEQTRAEIAKIRKRHFPQDDE